MNRKMRLGLAAAAVLVVTGVSGGVAIAAGNNASDPTSDDVALTGATLQKASQAALDATGGGQVIASEEGNEGIAYELEVLTTDGKTIEVQLDRSFTVTHQQVDTPDQGGSED